MWTKIFFTASCEGRFQDELHWGLKKVCIFLLHKVRMQYIYCIFRSLFFLFFCRANKIPAALYTSYVESCQRETCRQGVSSWLSLHTHAVFILHWTRDALIPFFKRSSSSTVFFLFVWYLLIPIMITMPVFFFYISYHNTVRLASLLPTTPPICAFILFVMLLLYLRYCREELRILSRMLS